VKKYLKYTLTIFVCALLAYKSVYFKKLSEMEKKSSTNFNAAVFVKKLWEEKLPAKLDSTIELTELIKAVTLNPADALAKYANAIAIGNYQYALVNVHANVSEVNEDDLLIQLPWTDSLLPVKIATEFVYGNAIRDASGLIDVKEFSNTADLNSISEELNRMVKLQVIAPFKKIVKKTDSINVVGAVELNKEHLHWKNLEIIPLRLQILH
jgi:predicted lipoprotein